MATFWARSMFTVAVLPCLAHPTFANAARRMLSAAGWVAARCRSRHEASRATADQRQAIEVLRG